MIITANEYKEMGFDATDDALLEKCIKRAEFVLNGISSGRAATIALGSTPAADYVKQAAAFQTYAIYREETALLAESSESSEQSGSSSKTDERVTIGDFTYSTGTSSSSSSGSVSKSSSELGIEPLDINQTVAKLLRAAGCFYGAAEVKE